MKPLLRGTPLLVILALLIGARGLVAGRATGAHEQSLASSETLIWPDGTLNVEAGFTGNLDPLGSTMMGEPGQSPRLVRSDRSGEIMSGPGPYAVTASGDENWSHRIGVPGVCGGVVYALAVTGTTVYVGGAFTMAGNVPALNIAKWDSDTGTWSALGGGLNFPVYAIAVKGDDVYVGGDFTETGDGLRVNRIAKWDSTSDTWSALSMGVGGSSFGVRAIAVSGSDVYVGGIFSQAIGVPGTSGIAKWDGTRWSALGSGICSLSPAVCGDVRAIVVSGTDVYVGGSFPAIFDPTLNRNLTVNSIAKWNGTSWSALGSGLSPVAGAVCGYTIGCVVQALAVSGDDVYVGGLFTTVGGVPLNSIARWDTKSSTWSALGSGVAVGYGPFVYALAVAGEGVYVGGNFTMAGGVPVNYIARWDRASSSWSALGSGVAGGEPPYPDPSVRALAAMADGVYVGGGFTQVGRDPACHLAQWIIGNLDIIDPNPDLLLADGSINTDKDALARGEAGRTAAAADGVTRLWGCPARC